MENLHVTGMLPHQQPVRDVSTSCAEMPTTCRPSGTAYRVVDKGNWPVNCKPGEQTEIGPHISCILWGIEASRQHTVLPKDNKRSISLVLLHKSVYHIISIVTLAWVPMQ